MHQPRPYIIGKGLGLESQFAIDLSNDVKCGKVHATLNTIGSIFLHSQSNFV